TATPRAGASDPGHFDVSWAVLLRGYPRHSAPPDGPQIHDPGGLGPMPDIRVTLDGVRYHDQVAARRLLLHAPRWDIGETDTQIGCDTSSGGACTVLVDGLSVKSCSVLASQADGSEIRTVEGLARDGRWHPLQRAFHRRHALQCGYCTPGMLMAS